MDLMTQLKGSFGIITNPDVITYLLRGVAFTLGISLIAILCSIVVGSIFGLLRNYCRHGVVGILGKLATCYIELFRNTPLMLWMFVCFVLCPAPTFTKGFATALGLGSVAAVKRCSRPLWR